MINLISHSIQEVQQLSYNEQFMAKKQHLTQLMSPFYEDEVQAFKSPEAHYRMRAEFRIWHQGADSYHIMFNQETKERYRVDTLEAACSLISSAMQAAIGFITQQSVLRTKLFQIDYLATTTNELVISLLYHKKLDEQWQAAAKHLLEELGHLGNINIIGRARKQKVVVGNDFVTEKLLIKNTSFSFKQIENSFTQPNAVINTKMIEWVIDNINQDDTDLLELYCGAGNFSIPLSLHFRKVLATEISKTSVNAAQFNIQANNIDNLVIARLSSEEFVEAFNRVRAFNRLANIDLDSYAFSTVLVDPPRAGLDETTLQLVSSFNTIIYVSCNPSTLVANMQILIKTHRVIKVALFDQFPFTHHMESGLILQKR
ncbi:tRNA (uracil-5-)-methyltransferase [Glaciecola punicea ACAM 611]|uniref:tRNA/tmRNA (uracil-C(5))-methyltransferase n=1 Tax=Glaciecola punicea ACAM 611 TaxID=1121923 RepID=H5TD85_9ALTE|nr:tRNA (uridine(54)-C5)-methyltransferase TrmA [Glaciecola punicea]GAB56262.1 tRNA (uracil-5-)-methyltransferase [Glaciecola punicea ACAM 611]